ncbi:MAG TPA: hypothetical protein VK774_07645 [Solirubrobacteraceae bacterium]|jgi:hypothetical protein|nr:hypothetical protein [Solirubrobacteraceae bacterium]
MSATQTAVTLDELVLADSPDRWRALGFELDGDRLQLGTVSLRLAGTGAGRGIVSWSLHGASSSELDGLPTALSDDREPREPAAAHANGIGAIDHVVAMTPALDRSVQALKDAGLDLRRIREEPTPAGAPRQAFFRLGAVILEVVQEPEHVLAAREGGADRPARLWGLALLAPDLDRTVAALGECVGEPRDAVQHGRRIATIKRSAGLAVPVALITPKPSA